MSEPGFDQYFSSVIQGHPYSDLRVFNLVSGEGIVIGTAGKPAQLSNDSVRRLRDLLSEYLGEAPSATAANRRLQERIGRVLEKAADQLDALPAGGEALKGPYWYKQGVHNAADLLRDWADSDVMLSTLTADS